MKFLMHCFLCLSLPAFAQEPKGAAPLSSLIAHHSTRAVVVGISNYQDEGIPDLRFADRDAEAFANFLRSPAGGSLDGDHLQVLTNQNATAGRIAEALDALLEQAKEGDQVIIYFSGHGDVERKTVSQPGFLLCWDAPARVYMGGGTYSLAYLQEIVTTLTTQNKAKVVVVTDACHAGKLAGSQIGGAQLTAANLARQFTNEVKILSCQPGEFSLEGEQWGGGRGCFSYHLVDGLFGLADRNDDGLVSVGELDRYLEDRVTTEAAPQSQVPMLLGNKTEPLARVNAKILADLQKAKAGGLPVFTATEGRGLEDEILAKADSGVRAMFFAFKKAVREKRFFPEIENVGRVQSPSNAGQSADELYAQLSQNQALAPLHGMIRRNYAAALQDEAQQTLNGWLKTSREISLEAEASSGNTRLPIKVFTEKVRSFPRCLDRAAELLGSRHYMYPALRARRYFFEGYLLANSDRNPNQELGDKALTAFRQALSWQPELPHVYWQMSLVFGNNFLQPDSLEHYTRYVLAVYPNWTTPYTEAAFLFSFRYRQHDRARSFLEQASRTDSSSAEVLIAWANYNACQNNFPEAEQQYKKAIALDSTNAAFLSNLAYVYNKTGRFDEAEPFLKKAIALDSTDNLGWSNLGYLYFQTGRFDEAEPVLKKAIALDSTAYFPLTNLGYLYALTKRFDEAELLLKKAIALDSTFVNAWNNLGYMYNGARRYDESEPLFKKAISLDSTFVYPWNNLGWLYSQTGRYAEAEPVLKKAIAVDSTYINSWVNLGYLYNLTSRYAEAEPLFKKAIALDSTVVNVWNNLGFSYLQTRRYAEAELVFIKAIALDSTYANPHKSLGMVFFKTNRSREAGQSFQKAIELNPNYAGAMLGMAYLLAAEGKSADALGYVEQAIGKGSTFEQLESDTDLAPLRALPEWKVLMKKRFPDQAKD